MTNTEKLIDEAMQALYVAHPAEFGQAAGDIMAKYREALETLHSNTYAEAHLEAQLSQTSDQMDYEAIMRYSFNVLATGFVVGAEFERLRSKIENPKPSKSATCSAAAGSRIHES